MLVVLVTLVALVAVSWGGETQLSGLEGHPRTRLLPVWLPPTSDAALGVEAFSLGGREAAQVRVTLEPPTTKGLMGLTHLTTDDAGAIQLPISITVIEPVARGQTSGETLLYQVMAHELGHALGLPHARDPASLMCCPPVRSARAQLSWLSTTRASGGVDQVGR